jgi:hypothetical protein
VFGAEITLLVEVFGAAEELGRAGHLEGAAADALDGAERLLRDTRAIDFRAPSGSASMGSDSSAE